MQFVGQFPRVPLLKLLPVWIGWPAAVVACWKLRTHAKLARIALGVTLSAGVLAIVRACIPVQTRVSMTELTEFQVAMGSFVLTLSLSIVRDVVAIVAIFWIGKLAVELAEPVDDDGSLVEPTTKHFRWWIIGCIAALIVLYSTFGAMFAMGPVAFAEKLVSLPRFARRCLFAFPPIARLVPCWSVVLVLYTSTMAWHALAKDWEAGHAGDPDYKFVHDPAEEA